MATNFAVPGNNVSTTVKTATSGSGTFPQTLNLAVGTASKFPAITGSQKYRVTICQVAFAYSPTATTSNYTVYMADTLSTTNDTIVLESLSTTEGQTQTDRIYNVGDIVEVRVTAGTLSDIHTAVNALENAGSSMAIGSTVTGGTANSALYVDAAGKLGQDNAHYSWTDSTQQLFLKSSTTTSALTVVNDYTAPGPYCASFGRSNSAAHALVTFVGTSSVTTSAPAWSMGMPGGTSNYAFQSWDGATLDTYISIATPASGRAVTLGFAQNTIIKSDGSVQLPTIANASAANSSLFIDSSASNKLCWKDSGGTLHYST